MTLCLPALAEAQNYNQLVAFGGSTTDTGWYANAKLSPVPNLFDVGVASAIAAGGNAHFTGPGLGNAQILGGFFGVPANPANTPGGTNYAIGGSFINSAPAPDAAWTNFILLDFGLPPNPALPAMTGQISNYLASVNGRANPNALYLIGGREEISGETREHSARTLPMRVIIGGAISSAASGSHILTRAAMCRLASPCNLTMGPPTALTSI